MLINLAVVPLDALLEVFGAIFLNLVIFFLHFCCKFLTELNKD